MLKKVIKRDGKCEAYDFNKVVKAVTKAFNSKDIIPSQKLIDQLKEDVEKTLDKYDDETPVSIEEIQDIIRNFLMKKNKDVAESFILYRDQRNRYREQQSKLVKGIREKLEAKNIQNQNANVDEMSFGGRMGEANRVATKDIALNSCMSALSRNNHLKNRIYIHDLDSYAVGMSNCLSIPFDDLLKNGFKTRQTDVRPANSINTATQLVAVIFQLQSLQQFGGVSATHIDWTLAPYVKKSFFKHFVIAYMKDTSDFVEIDLMKMLFDTYTDAVGIERNKFEDWIDEHKQECLDRLLLTEDDFYLGNEALCKKYYQSALYDTIEETKQAVEGMYHNLNTLQSRSGNQLPFTSINYGTCTSEEGRLVTQTLLMGSLKGTGALHTTPIFPCGIFQCMTGVNRKPGDKNYDLFQLALKSTSKRLYPNYANVDWTGNAGYDRNDPRTYFSTMGCRTANGWDINGFGQLKDGRGNICPVTIILPTIAMEARDAYGEINYPAKNDGTPYTVVDKFLEILEKCIGEAKDTLIERFNWICKQPADSAKFMYENNTMAGYDGKNISSALKHGTLAVGQLGLAECLQILVGTDHTTDKGMEVAKRVELLFKTKCAEYKEKYKLNFGVYYTPAENLCKTALRNFRKTYGVIPNVSDREYFTNSMHVPVWHDVNPFTKIDIESQLTGYSSAGCITYVELPSTSKHNIEALETLVNYAMDKDIPYFAVNVPNDTCMDCGYTDEFGETCPMCGGTNIQRLRRVTGYLTGNYLTAFNDGKIAEVHDRVKHVKN